MARVPRRAALLAQCQRAPGARGVQLGSQLGRELAWDPSHLLAAARRVDGDRVGIVLVGRVATQLERATGPDVLPADRLLMMRGRSLRGRRRDETRAAVGHALAYTTWRSLAREQGLDDAQAAELMCGLVR